MLLAGVRAFNSRGAPLPAAHSLLYSQPMKAGKPKSELLNYNISHNPITNVRSLLLKHELLSTSILVRASLRVACGGDDTLIAGRGRASARETSARGRARHGIRSRHAGFTSGFSLASASRVTTLAAYGTVEQVPVTA
jgi:hypothetical protein